MDLSVVIPVRDEAANVAPLVAELRAALDGLLDYEILYVDDGSEDETAADGRVTSVVRQWDRRHWGEGGDEFHWWCTEAPDAFVGKKPVYEEMQAELTKMVGPKVYEQFVALLKERDSRRTHGVALPHPAVRTRGTDSVPAEVVAASVATVGAPGAENGGRDSLG